MWKLVGYLGRESKAVRQVKYQLPINTKNGEEGLVIVVFDCV